jgi:hypothetical protein
MKIVLHYHTIAQLTTTTFGKKEISSNITPQLFCELQEFNNSKLQGFLAQKNERSALINNHCMPLQL